MLSSCFIFPSQFICCSQCILGIRWAMTQIKEPEGPFGGTCGDLEGNFVIQGFSKWNPRKKLGLVREKSGRGPLSILDGAEVDSPLPLELTSLWLLVPSALGGTSAALLLGGGSMVDWNAYQGLGLFWSISVTKLAMTLKKTLNYPMYHGQWEVGLDGDWDCVMQGKATFLLSDLIACLSALAVLDSLCPSLSPGFAHVCLTIWDAYPASSPLSSFSLPRS